MSQHTMEEKMSAFGRLLDIQYRLRKECPWDRKQTTESLRPYTIEEVYELCDALIRGDWKNICKELGDVIEHVIFYAMIGEEAGEFDIADACNAQSDKLMFRHDFIDWSGWTVTDPELTVNSKGQVVYKNEAATTEENAPTTEAEVESAWEQRKQQERHGNKTVLSGVPATLPTLIKAYRIQDKARNVGFDWKNKDDVWEKVGEEMGELEIELKKGDKERSTRELGDFLFSVVNAARLYHLNPDNALELTNQKFIRRFSYVERKLKEAGKDFADSSLEEMDRLWDEAKAKERQTDKTE